MQVYFIVYKLRYKAFATFLWWQGYRVNPIFTTITAASKNDVRLESGQK